MKFIIFLTFYVPVYHCDIRKMMQLSRAASYKALQDGTSEAASYKATQGGTSEAACLPTVDIYHSFKAVRVILFSTL